MSYVINPTKIHDELDWLPETKSVDGIQKTIQWVLMTNNAGKLLFLENIKIIMKKCIRIDKVS